MPDPDKSDRVSQAIFAPDKDKLARREKRSAWTHVASGAGTKLAEKLSSPELVLPWFLGALGAPIALVGLLMPIRHAASLLPQLLLVGALGLFKRRKYAWGVATLAQGVAIGVMAGAAWFSDPAMAGWWLVLFFAIFSLARGLASLSHKDALARSAPEGTRGSIMGVRGAVAGGMGLVAGAALQLRVGQAAEPASFPPLLWLAAGLMILAALAFMTLPESAPEEESNASESIRAQIAAGWRLLGGQDFRRFVMVRGLFLAVPLAYPFFALEGQAQFGAKIGGLGIMIITISLAEIVSNPMWGRLANQASHQVMARGGGVFLLSLGVLVTGRLVEGWASSVLFVIAFFLLGLSYAGVRLGRKTYLVEAVGDADRALHVATANSCIGVLTLSGFGLAVIANWADLNGVLLTLGAVVGAATWMANRLAAPDDFHPAGKSPDQG